MLPPIREFSTLSVPVRDFAQQPGYTLRELNPSDLNDFIELGLPTCAFMHGKPDVPAEKMRRDFASFVRDYAFDGESEVYVVEAPDKTLAAQLWLHSTRNRFNRYDEMWVWDVTVREEHQRKGLGHHLMDVARRRADEKNCAELWLLVSSMNNRAMRVYESVGLRTAGLLMSQMLHPNSDDSANYIAFKTVGLRPLQAEDTELLYGLWAAAGLPCKPRGRDRAERLRRHLSQPSGGGWGAFDGGELIAAALYSFDGRKGFIERLATRPDRRKSGLAKAIVAACSKSLKESGALVVAALIESDNSASRALFESIGFVNHPHLCYYTFRENPDC